MRRRLSVFLLAGLACAACSAAPTQKSGSTFLVGAIYPLTGPQAPGGQQELAGVRLALELARERHAFGARDVRLVVRSAKTPQAAAAAVDSLLDQDHVAMLMGTYGSTLAEAAAQRAEERHAVYWESGAVADPVTQNKRYVFRTVAAGSTLGREAVDFTAQVLLPRFHLQPAAARAVIVYVNDTYGRSVADGERAQAAAQHIPVAAAIGYDARLYDAPAIAEQIRALHPDFLWDVSYIDDGVAIWQQVVAAGVRLRGAIGTSSAFCMPQFGARLGRTATGVYAADKPDDQVSPQALTPAARALLEAGVARYAREHSGASMRIPAMAGFVAGWTLFSDVLSRLGADTGSEAIRQAALQVDVPVGAAVNGGGVRFGPDGAPDAGQNQLAAADVGQWQWQGGSLRMNVVYPAAYVRGGAAPG